MSDKTPKNTQARSTQVRPMQQEMGTQLRINPPDLLQNLRDLNFVTSRITREMEEKNGILEAGLMECDSCSKFIR